jgi:hypothetical protein
MTERQKKLKIKRKSESVKKKTGMIIKEGFKTVVYDEHGKAIGEQG